ncbi:DUF805 domain-containing protein [Hahella sp. CCB-MM4]|nr:DUF805 domain-containing protein [Hahella sp. CCB-MM4]
MTLKQVLFSFSGRVGRKVYWLAILGMIAFWAIIGGLATVLGKDSNVVAAIAFVFYIPFIWISLAVQVKRWHDRNKSGWWVLIGIIPLIGAIWVFIENGLLAGDQGMNDYGMPSA